ncbi:hypothetical protein C8J56DRAFT_1113503 [Mycena floridula]|nr:hypothetical protein C8J56DRAFT_1113503 [Mycena floridula]
MTESYKLVYFVNSWARSDVSLMALQITGAKYEYIEPSFADWPPLKGEQKFGHLPRLDVKKADGTTRSLWESKAIEVYLGEKLGLLSTDLFERAESMSIISSIGALRETVWNVSNLASIELRAAQHEKHITETIPEALEWHEAIIAKSGGPYYAGKFITLPDLVLLSLHLVFRELYGDGNPLVKFPKTNGLVETLLSGKLGTHASQSRAAAMWVWKSEILNWGPRA